MSATLPTKAKKGRAEFDRLRKKAKDAGVYEAAKELARERREDGKGYVSAEDLKKALSAAGKTIATTQKLPGTDGESLFTAWHFNL